MFMPKSIAKSLGGALSVLVCAPLAAIAGEDRMNIATNGAIILMPDIERLDCLAMADVIQRIDFSGYRDPDAAEPAPDHPDRSIFEYESALTAQEYFQCTLGASQDTDPALAFEKN